MKMFASSAGVPTIEIMSETELDSFYSLEGRRLVMWKYPCMGFATVYDDTFLLVRVIKYLNTSFNNGDNKLSHVKFGQLSILVSI